MKITKIILHTPVDDFTISPNKKDYDKESINKALNEWGETLHNANYLWFWDGLYYRCFSQELLKTAYITVEVDQHED